MIKTYELYIIKLFLRKFLNIFLIFISLVFILNLFEEVSFFKDLNLGLFFPIFIGTLNMPATLFEIFPFIFLISTQLFFLDIINKNELEILKINGLSNLRITMTLFLTSIILGFVLVSVYYNISAKLKFSYLEIKNSYSSDNKYLAVVKESGLWIKDEINNKILIVNSGIIEKNFLFNISIHEFDNDFNLIRTIESEKADISNQVWVVHNPIIFKDNKTQKLEEVILIKTHFDKDKINSLFNNLSSLTLTQLLKLKKDYESLGYTTAEVDSHLQKLYSFPLFTSIMTILASIIMFNNKRNHSVIFHLIEGILLSVIIYYFYYLFNLFGENGKMPIIVSIYLPFVILLLVSLIGLINLNEK